MRGELSEKELCTFSDKQNIAQPISNYVLIVNYLQHSGQYLMVLSLPVLVSWYS
jgi:hypothetical protein